MIPDGSDEATVSAIPGGGLAVEIEEMVDLAAAHGLPRLSMNMIIPAGTPNRPEHQDLRIVE